MNVFVVGEAIRESVSQTKMAAVVAGTDSQPRFEGQDRASQITARLFRNGQAHHAMRVDFPARFFYRLTLTAIRTQGRMIYSARAAESCSVQREAASIGFIISLQRIIVFHPSRSWQRFLLGAALFTSLRETVKYTGGGVILASKRKAKERTRCLCQVWPRPR